MILLSPGLSEKAEMLRYQQSGKIAYFPGRSRVKKEKIYSSSHFKLKKSQMLEAQKKQVKEWQEGLTSKILRRETDLQPIEVKLRKIKLLNSLAGLEGRNRLYNQSVL